MKKFAVLLSGCGQYDGTELYEGIYTITALAQLGIDFEAIAPDIKQSIVFDHYHQERMQEARNVLIESARFVRGKNIKSLSQVNATDYQGVIVPGGRGIVMNLSDFAEKGLDFSIQSDVYNFLNAAAAAHLPMGFICIASILVPRIYQNVRITIGTAEDLAKMIQEMGCVHVNCAANDIVIDEKNHLVTTPANMLAKNTLEVLEGIQKLVNKLNEFSNGNHSVY
jgi:enhancing lycopene biosynthesis protein 2